MEYRYRLTEMFHGPVHGELRGEDDFYRNAYFSAGCVQTFTAIGCTGESDVSNCGAYCL